MKVILLLGPSSAGKTTLCDTLVKEHGWYTHGCDQVGETIQKEASLFLAQKLKEYGFIEPLSPFMSEAEVITLAATGKLELVYNDTAIKHQFSSPDFQGLETILSQAGFAGIELENLTKLLHKVGKLFEELPPVDGLERMIEDIFKLPSNATVIIDDVPPPDGNVKAMIQDFKERLSEHAKSNGCEVEYATVLAFCTPKVLSKRIQNRNKAAYAPGGDLENKREGSFPFLQLSQLIVTVEADGLIDEAKTLSKLQLLMIALMHLPPEIGEGNAKKAKAIFKAGAHEYKKLMNEFKLSRANNVMIMPREDLDAHAVIDLTKEISTSELARELVAKTKDIPSLSVSTSNISL